MNRRPSRTSAKIILSSGLQGHDLVAERGQRHPSGIIPSRRLKRIGAFALDGLMLPFFLIFTPFGWFLAAFVYLSLNNNIFGRGRSLGRAALGQRLMTEDGQEAPHWMIVARNAVRFGLWMAVIPFFVDLLLLLFGDGRLLADRALGTRVVEDPERVARDRQLGARREQLGVRAAERPRWDDRHDQGELETIAGDLAFGQGGRDQGDAELAEFERRLRGDARHGEADPFLAELARGPEPAQAVVERHHEVVEGRR